ncbi:MAG: hypothetical protein JWM80_106 [Cyanobacteria bacterium RYN_339]|nr:hypothetical protein [Cyanobacteria bacterium RYN_339]
MTNLGQPEVCTYCKRALGNPVAAPDFEASLYSAVTVDAGVPMAQAQAVGAVQAPGWATAELTKKKSVASFAPPVEVVASARPAPSPPPVLAPFEAVSLAEPEAPRLTPTQAVVCSLVIPGLGQVLKGQAEKGFAILAVIALLGLLFGAFPPLILLWILNIVDAHRVDSDPIGPAVAKGLAKLIRDRLG